MISLTDYRASVGKVLAIGSLLATLHVVLLSPFPADGAVPSGKAYSWGDNSSGELGNGTSGPGTDKNVPGAVVNLTGVKSVKAGCDHGLAVKTDGTVRAWGDNRAGQLGNGTIDDSDVPVRVRIENVKAISAGCSHNLALKENGTVWAWGGNNHGQLGNDTSGSYSDVPVKVASLGTGAKTIAAGNEFSLALMKDGTVRSWGDNHYG
jgi:alpha-tubulin suppressor-like RCC1 family protein